MAERESITQAPGLFGSWTAARAAKLGEEAFQVAAHMALQERDPAEWPTGEQFAESVAWVFEALVQARTWPRANQWALERLAEVPVGFRPGYEAGRLRREHAKAQARSRVGGEQQAKRCALAVRPGGETPGEQPRFLEKTMAGDGTLDQGAVTPSCALAAVTSTWLFGGRSEAQGGGEAPLQSGGPN